MKTLRGSFSVEAAIIMPLVLSVIVIAITSAVSLHEETKEIAEQVVAGERWDPVEMMYDLDLLKSILGEKGEN